MRDAVQPAAPATHGVSGFRQALRQVHLWCGLSLGLD
jgi:hypothetical protein